MDFSQVELSTDDQTFCDELKTFLTEHVTEEVRQRDRETGENFDESVHLALGEAGYLWALWQSPDDGGFTPVRKRIWDLEIQRAEMPWYHGGVTFMVAHVVDQFATPELKAEVMPGVLSGHVRLCLGLTEPEGGSDVATCKTRSVRDGDHWIINGSKMFTSNAHNAQFVFLVTNSDPDAPKHQSLTMFLVPLDSAGVEIQPIRTIDGDRTNITYYSDVRIPDKYRLGEVNAGWTVLRSALNAEHGIVEKDATGLQKTAAMVEHLTLMAQSVDTIAGMVAAKDANGRCALDDESVSYRLGRGLARIEAGLSTPDMFGRVAVVQAMRDVGPEMMDIVGTASALPVGTPGEADDGGIEYAWRLSLPSGIYGGTLEVFRNMIAQHALGLGRPNYSPART